MKKIKAIVVYEILGRPAEHIKDSLEKYIDKISQNKGVKLISKKVNEPKEVEEKEKKGLFSSFAEVEFEIDDQNILFDLVLGTMPAHIEILDPDEFKINNFELTSTLNNLAIKLHKFDAIASSALIERQNLLKKLKKYEEKKD